MTKPIYQCMTKAVVGDGDQLQCGPNWMFSRRGTLKLFDDHLEMGQWKIPYGEIQQSILSSFHTPMLRLPGFVLAIRTNDQTYHFGLNGGKFWKEELPFAVQRQQSRLKLSWLSLFSRVTLLACLVYLLWRLI